MRRRITAAILGCIAAALVLAGLGTLALNRIGARASARHEIENQADATAAVLELATARRDPATGVLTVRERRQRLVQVRKALQLEEVSLVIVDGQGELRPEGDPLPDGVTLGPNDLATLRAGTTVGGTHGRLVYAIAPVTAVGGLQPLVVLTRNIGPTLGTGVWWFLLASGVTLALGAIVADRLSRRLIRPLTEATAATARIAGDDLSVRLPTHPGGGRDELDDLGGAINHLADSLARSRGLERQFLLSVSHDLRTPLTSIRGYAEAIADGAAPDPPAAGGVILSEARRLERLVRDLLDLAKLESRQFSLHPRTVDVAELAGDAVESFSREATASGVTIHLVRPPGPVRSHVDPDRLGQVIANLVENALKYAASAITVTVITDARPRLEVTDDGPGIAAEDLPHVYERLYVAALRPQRKEIGSGLGLAIVRELVEAMGGSVRAESGPAGGAQMVVELPPPTA